MAKKKKLQFPKIPIFPVLLFLLLLFLSLVAYGQVMADKYFPVSFIGNTNISFLNKGQAIRKFSVSFDKRSKEKLQFGYAQGAFEIDLATSSATPDYSSFDLIFNSGRTGNFWNNFTSQIQTLAVGLRINPKITFNLKPQTDKIAEAVKIPYKDAEVVFDETNIQIKEAAEGLELDQDKLEESVSQFLLTGHLQSQLPIKSVSPKISTDYAQKAKQALEDTMKNPIILNFNSEDGEQSWTIDTKSLLTLLDLTSGQNLLLDKDKTYLYLKNIASQIDQPVQEGLFEFNPDTKRVSNFRPSQEGRKLNIDKTYQLITEAIIGAGKQVDLPVEVVKPKIQTSDVNSLGIKELIGRGISHFAGSIPNRVYNVNLTASKINGVLIPPGEVFSFNQTVGDITAATGFKQAYVIKEGRTVLDDGGGVCQDSTTLFRAVLNAGLPVVKRTAHAYRVGYYEQGYPPGLDATVYYPSVDFQFKNDTTAHILIQAYTSGTSLYIDLYGTSDGRVAQLSRSVVTDQTPAPPELRQDDPTLPKGVVKQVDFAAAGAKVSFNRTVTRNGEVIAKETWRSSYKPWQAVYLVGTKE